jgi:hypothetical protein
MMISGEIEISLLKTDGEAETLTLKPSAQAMTALSRYAQGQGLISLVNRCAGFDFDTIHQVVVAGIGGKTKDYSERVYKTGLGELSASCIRFITVLANGGRPVKDEDDAKDGE